MTGPLAGESAPAWGRFRLYVQTSAAQEALGAAICRGVALCYLYALGPAAPDRLRICRELLPAGGLNLGDAEFRESLLCGFSVRLHNLRAAAARISPRPLRLLGLLQELASLQLGANADLRGAALGA